MGRAIRSHASISPHGRGQRPASWTRVHAGDGYPEISSLIDLHFITRALYRRQSVGSLSGFLAVRLPDGHPSDEVSRSG